MTRSLPVFLAAFLFLGCRIEPDNPLIGAARSGNTESIRSLLARGADPNQTWGVNNWTPLMHAVHKNQKGSVEALLTGGADVNARVGKGITALIMAAGYGYVDIVQVLLDKGADPYLETADGDSALSAAISGVPDIDKFTVGKCQTATVQALLAKAPGLKLKDNSRGRIARMTAGAAGCAAVLSLIGGQTSERSPRGHV